MTHEADWLRDAPTALRQIGLADGLREAVHVGLEVAGIDYSILAATTRLLVANTLC